MRNRLYTAAFLSALALTAVTISYLEGCIDQHMHENRDIHVAIAEEQAKSAYWQGKYQSLSHEADFLTVVSAEQGYQEAQK